MKNRKVALITGTSGFIGFHLTKKLINDGWSVVGIDNLNDYYDVSLKLSRENELAQFENFQSIRGDIENEALIHDIFKNIQPLAVIHLAAQAGVRYSIENPRSYITSNIIGTFNILEACRRFVPEHLLMASTSSAYGANKSLPYKEIDKADHQLSIYAATKKSTENLAHSYSHLFGIPVTMFRFFTVYGPWGRPDMALFKFTDAILNDREIEIYNHGKMARDFTYIDDLVQSISLLIKESPSKNTQKRLKMDSLSPVAPFRVVNIGNSTRVSLLNYIEELELNLGLTAKKKFLPMQAGDVSETIADNRLLQELTNFCPDTTIQTGIAKFVDWYKNYYEK